MPAPSRGPWLFRNVTRAFDFWPTLESISITQEYPDMTASLSCEVIPAEGLLFDVEDEVRVTFSGDRIWAGHLKSVTEAYRSEAGPGVWRMDGQDYTAKLSDAIIRRKQKRKREKAVRRVRWLLSYLRGKWTLSGRDLSHIPDSTVEAYDYYGATVDEGLAHVADELRMHYFIDLDNVFQMYRSENVAAPFALDNDAPDYAASYPFREWSRTRDSVELANAILVEPEKRKHARWSKDAASITAYGRQERFISDSNLHRPKQALNVGARTLNVTAEPAVEGGAVVDEPGIWAGMSVHVTDAVWERDETVFVSNVEIAGVDPHDEEGAAYLRSTLTFADKRRRRRPAKDSVNKLARRRPGETEDTDPYLLDHFSRTVESPGIEAGDALTADPDWYALTWGDASGGFSGVPKAYNGGIPYGPTLTTVGLASPHFVDGVAGDTNTSWPGAPCGVGPGAWSGWHERESWVDYLTVPAHPAGMAGILLTLTRGSGGYGLAKTEPFRVYVRSDAPSTGRSGAVIGTIEPGATATLLIPPESVPAEGEHLWLGFGPAWEPNYGVGWYCGVGFGTPMVTGYQNSGRGSAPTIGATWAETTDDLIDLGETAHPAKAPWEGPWDWRLIGTEGSPAAYGIDGDALYVTGPGGIGVALFGEREDDTQPYGVWSDMAFALEAEFVSDAADSGSLELSAQGEGEQALLTADLAAGTLVAQGPTSADSDAVAWTTDAWLMVIDTRSRKVRGKAWLSGSPEPADWNVESAMDETEDDADRLVLWLRAEASQTVRVTRTRLMQGGGDGRRVVKEWVGYASGVTRKLTTRHPFREGTLRAFVNGTGVPPTNEDGDEAEYWLGFAPSPGAPIRNTYIIDVGTGDE